MTPFYSQEGTDIILDCIADGVFTVDMDWRITSFNRAAERITGIKQADALGSTCKKVMRADLCESGCALRRTIETGDLTINQPVHIVDAQGRRKFITISTALLKDKAGGLIGGVETFRDMTMVEELRKQLRKQYTFEDIISRNHTLEEYFKILPQIAESDCTVLIEGPTGTGKELMAQAIHNLSRRQHGPFVAINCGALPDTLLESELFGYVAGAFTDAKKDKPGRFELARTGTLFLDEIGDVSPALQVRLLRVLQEKNYEPVGAVNSVKADVRILAATNKQLDQEVKAGQFREDLYYRINVVKLTLPPLKERKEDIPMLVDHFVHRFNRIYGRDICCVSDDVLAELLRYDFPGNIRELENLIEHGFVLCQGHVIEMAHLPGALTGKTSESALQAARFKTLRQMEAVMIEQALKRHKGNRAATARELDINTSTLFRKLKLLHIESVTD
ncbi:MAG: sigma 54-interacting transcriptional regulator [Phycisphaeraceae bacterium]|nr:sigma 54-interacting transcriptional regulator [Phycisphaeraceae bacterium]